MASSMEKPNEDGKNVGSKQLLYSDVFGESYHEDRLRIVGKSNTQNQRQTFSVPSSSVLSQIKSFLPRLFDANAKMAKDIESNPEKAEEVNIECVDDEGEGKHIEMNISMIPDVGEGGTLDESESDESSDEGEDVEDNDGDSDEKGSNNATDLNSKDLMKLKLPSSSKTKRKQKAQIEEIETVTSTFEEETTNR